MRRLIAPILAALRGGGVAPPYRLVGVGCGLGHAIRWLAARGELGSDVELIGCDEPSAPRVGTSVTCGDLQELPSETTAWPC